MNHFARQFFNWLAVVLWLGVIFYFSSQPNLASDFQPLWDLIFRKIAHVAEYFVLAYLWLKALRAHGLSPAAAISLTVILAVTVAGLDEWHQYFVLGRQGKIWDVLIDCLGVISLLVLEHRYGKNLLNH